jgi:heme exporter protein C
VRGEARGLGDSTQGDQPEEESMGPTPRGLRILTWVTAALLAVALYMVFVYAPEEAVMGQVQRVFYFHVSAGWVGALAFLVTAIAGGVYLARGDRRWDRLAVSSVEVGVVFTFINIVSGSIWAKPIWNTWWTWDPRLVTATVMELVYVAYMLLRQGIEDPDRRARFGAVYAIVGFLSVPLTFLSIRLFRTIHPVVIGSGDPTAQGAFDMTPRMLQAFMFSLLTFTFVYATVVWHRVRLEGLHERIEQLKLRMLSA